MDNAYKIMFAVGVLYTFVSFLISGLSGAFHLGSHAAGHVHFDGHHGHSGHIGHHHAHAGTHSGGASDTLFSWFSILINPLVAVSFLTVFGGLGMLGVDYFKWNSVLVLVVSLASGIIVASLLYRFVAIPLYKSENSTDVSRDDLIGKDAEVISTILENGFGKIGYVVNSIRYTAPAKHMEDKAVLQGEKVVICKIENNVFYVTELNKL